MMFLRALVYYLLLVTIVVPYWVLVMCVAPLPRIPRWKIIAGWPRLAAWLQPVVQIAASLPATALFPVLLLLVLGLPGGLDVAAILLMLLGTQWYLLFNIIAGASAIPRELRYTSDLLQLSRWERWRSLILPAIFPYAITGAIAAGGGAWNASVVAEYTQFGGKTFHTIGVGALIAEATGAGDFPLLLAATLALILTVALDVYAQDPPELVHRHGGRHEDRLLGARGEGEWKRVSWEEAIQAVAGELRGYLVKPRAMAGKGRIKSGRSISTSILMRPTPTLGGSPESGVSTIRSSFSRSSRFPAARSSTGTCTTTRRSAPRRSRCGFPPELPSRRKDWSTPRSRGPRRPRPSRTRRR